MKTDEITSFLVRWFRDHYQNIDPDRNPMVNVTFDVPALAADLAAWVNSKSQNQTNALTDWKPMETAPAEIYQTFPPAPVVKVNDDIKFVVLYHQSGDSVAWLELPNLK